MDVEEILKLVKFNLGISLPNRDDYLRYIITSTIARLKRTGIDPEGQDEDYKSEYILYVADEAANMYRSRGGETPLPEGLRFRRNTLIVEKNDV